MMKSHRSITSRGGPTSTRRSLVTRSESLRALGSAAALLDQHVRAESITNAEWACVLLRDSDPRTLERLLAVARACAVADEIDAGAGSAKRDRPAGITDAQWACILLRDAAVGSLAEAIAIGLACEEAERCEALEFMRAASEWQEAE